jgi:hypothetical protein
MYVCMMHIIHRHNPPHCSRGCSCVWFVCGCQTLVTNLRVRKQEHIYTVCVYALCMHALCGYAVCMHVPCQHTVFMQFLREHALCMHAVCIHAVHLQSQFKHAISTHAVCMTYCPHDVRNQPTWRGVCMRINALQHLSCYSLMCACMYAFMYMTLHKHTHTHMHSCCSLNSLNTQN